MSAHGTKPCYEASIGRSAVDAKAAVRRTHRRLVLVTQSCPPWRRVADGGTGHPLGISTRLVCLFVSATSGCKTSDAFTFSASSFCSCAS